MIIGYSRLSRDDEKTKYVSIENQKKIISKYAEENGMIVDKMFEDDGYSGYTMDRPSFNEIKHLVDENLVDIIIAKDLSRVGRHNANVLLFLERLRAHNVRIILIDDSYDSEHDDDDMIGIKTWFNERFVKDGSKKVRNALKIMQESAELIHKVPYGYDKDPYVKHKYYVNKDIAVYVKKVFELYADGNGYKKTARLLNEDNIPTPSMVWHQQRLDKGLQSKVKVSTAWEPRTVKAIITNDFYIGTLRTRKTMCTTINGPQKKVDQSEQCVFEDAHEPIISKELFNLVQDLNKKHRESDCYKGERKYSNPYAGLLACGDCGRSLTIAHYNNTEVVSYACRNYRNQGAGVCTSHNISKKELNIVVKDYLQLCRIGLQDMIESLDSILLEQVKQSVGHENRLKVLNQNIESAKIELRTIMEQKIKEIASNPSMKDIITEMYDKIQADKMTSIEMMQTQIREYENIDRNKSEIKNNFKSAIEVFDSILKTEEFTSRQLNTLIDKIVVYENNAIEVKLKGELQNIFKGDVVVRMSKDDRIKCTMINYIANVSTFGIVKLMKEIRKTDSISYDTVVSLINEFVDKGYVIQTGDIHGTDRPPFTCIASKKEMLRGYGVHDNVQSILYCTDLKRPSKKCTKGKPIHRYSYLSTDFETIIKISTWIQRYI